MNIVISEINTLFQGGLVSSMGRVAHTHTWGMHSLHFLVHLIVIAVAMVAIFLSDSLYFES